MVKLNNVYKAFGDTKVLKGFTAEFNTGINLLLGHTGIGKTTVLNIIMGLEQSDAGNVEIYGGKRISAVFQEDRLLEKLDIIHNVAYVTDVSVNIKLASSLGLKEYMHKRVGELSGGTKRTVSLLRALSSEYDILILDEPFTGMDENIKKISIDVINQHSKGKTVIISTHDKYAIEYMGEKAKVIEVI